MAEISPSDLFEELRRGSITIPEWSRVKSLVGPYWNDADHANYFVMDGDRYGPFYSLEKACDAVMAQFVERRLKAEAEEQAADLLTERQIELFDLIQEECGEIIQARSKLRRGGERMGFKAPKNRPDGPTNIQLLKNEIMDVMVLLKIVIDEEGLITEADYDAYEKRKLERLEKYTDLYRRPGEPGWEDRLKLKGEL